MTFNSLTRSSNASFVPDRIFLTATVLDILFDPFIPTAIALNTTPNCPFPNCWPNKKDLVIDAEQ